ncbi:hypothetical protein [Pseudoduganella sp. HUAS MS19]
MDSTLYPGARRNAMQSLHSVLLSRQDRRAPGGRAGRTNRPTPGAGNAVYASVDGARRMPAGALHTPGGLVFDPDLPPAISDFRLSTLRCREVVRQSDRFRQREQDMLQQLRASYGIGDAKRNGR